MISKINKNAVRAKRPLPPAPASFRHRRAAPACACTAAPPTSMRRVIDDVAQATLAAASTLDKELKAQLEGKSKKGRRPSWWASSSASAPWPRGVTMVVFDRGGYQYTGRVAELAAGAREAGLEF